MCANCGSLNPARELQLYTSGLGQELADTSAEPGDVLDLELVDFEDGYFTLRAPTADEAAVNALEIWGCGVCHRVQFARLHFENVDSMHWRFANADVVALSQATLDDAHFISRNLCDWAPNPGDDVDRVCAVARRFGVTS